MKLIPHLHPAEISFPASLRGLNLEPHQKDPPFHRPRSATPRRARSIGLRDDIRFPRGGILLPAGKSPGRCNAKRHTKLRNALLLAPLIAFVAWGATAAVSYRQMPERARSPGVKAAAMPGEAGLREIPLLIYQPAEKRLRYAQTGRLVISNLKAAIGRSSLEVIDQSGAALPGWILSGWLDAGYSIVVMKPMDALFLRTALKWTQLDPGAGQILNIARFLEARRD